MKKVVEKDSDYVLSLKENQLTFCHEVQEYFSAAENAPKQYPEIKQMETRDCGHGRIERRTYYLSTEIDWYQDLAQWANLRAFGMVRSRTQRNGQICEETRYFITSLSDLPTFANAVRKHWGIENSLHWCLDMTFHEDYISGKIIPQKIWLLSAILLSISSNVILLTFLLPENVAAAPMTMPFSLMSFALFMRKPWYDLQGKSIYSPQITIFRMETLRAAI